MKYLTAFVALFCCFSHTVHSQEYSRDVIVTIDTTVEFNNTRKFGTTTDSYIKDGVEIKIFETPFQVSNITAKKSNNLDGLFMHFYLPSNMPQIKGTYKKNEKDGEWYYWKEDGILIRKETWRMGKLITAKEF